MEHKKLSVRDDFLLRINISSTAGLLSVEAVLLKGMLKIAAVESNPTFDVDCCFENAFWCWFLTAV